MIWFIIFELIIMVVFFGFAVYIHEWGHVLKLKRYGYNRKVVFDRYNKCFKVNVPNTLSLNQKIDVLFAGIILGLFTTFLSILFLKIMFVPLILIYLFGCRSDIKEIRRMAKLKKITKEYTN